MLLILDNDLYSGSLYKFGGNKDGDVCVNKGDTIDTEVRNLAVLMLNRVKQLFYLF